MRKYQQLALLIISTISVTILILYKNENNRLKDVLHVVNIFGRSDEAVLRRLETNTTNENEIPNMGPIPVWQALSDNYHSYAAYWNRNELMSGGEAIALVVGKRGAVVNFGCSLLYDGGLRNVRGKFHFQRVDDNNNDDLDSEFTSYNFFCRLVRDFGHPDGVIFNDTTSSKHVPPQLRIRHVKPLTKNSNAKSSINVCVNLVTTKHIKNEEHLMQFFLHHQGLGITDFLVYNGDEIPQHALQLLHHFNMRLHMFPFNFPFAINMNTTAAQRIRRIIETDCLIRNTNIATYATLLEPNEFFYPNTRLESAQSVLRKIHHYTGDTTRFELPTFAVCIDLKHKLLIDSTLYDPEVKMKHKLYIYRAMVPVTTKSEMKTQSVALSLSMAFAHRYIDCVKVGKDGLHDWRNSVREDFMQYLHEIHNELDMIL